MAKDNLLDVLAYLLNIKDEILKNPQESRYSLEETEDEYNYWRDRYFQSFGYYPSLRSIRKHYLLKTTPKHL